MAAIQDFFAAKTGIGFVRLHVEMPAIVARMVSPPKSVSVKVAFNTPFAPASVRTSPVFSVFCGVPKTVFSPSALNAALSTDVVNAAPLSMPVVSVKVTAGLP